MTKKSAAIIAMVAFVALIVPCAHLLSLVCAIAEAIFGVGTNPVYALMIKLNSLFGMWVLILAQILIAFLMPAFFAFLLYRYLLRRDFRQVCEDCAANKVRAWSLFAVFFLFTWISPASFLRPAVLDQNEPLSLDEAIEANPTVTLEMCLCHPDNDQLVSELSVQGRLTDEVLTGAPVLPGYRLMRMKGDDDMVCYVSQEVGLSREDVQSAEARMSFGGAHRDEVSYEVAVTFTPEGRAKFLALTKIGSMPSESGNKRALAIIVNGELLAAPLIFQPISDGVCVIRGACTRDEAITLAAALSAHF